MMGQDTTALARAAEAAVHAAVKESGAAPAPSHARPQHGPHVVLTRQEAQRVREHLTGSTDPVDRQILAKCVEASGADPVWMEPLK